MSRPPLPPRPPSLSRDQAVVTAGKEKGAALKLDLDISSEELEKKLRECLASRGRKATDPKVTGRDNLFYAEKLILMVFCFYLVFTLSV